MENFFRKYSLPLGLLCMFLACLLLAWNINSFIASRLAKYTVPELPDLRKQIADSNKPNSAKPAIADNTNMVEAINKRCLFGCTEPEAPKTCPDGCADGEICQDGQCVASPTSAQPEINNNIPVASTLGAKLIGVMVAKPNQHSSALLQGTEKQTIILNVGDMLLGEGELLEVHRDRIILRRNGRLEFIKLEGTLTAATPSPQQLSSMTRPSMPSSAPSAALSNPPLNNPGPPPTPSRKDVVETSPNNYEVDRKSLDKALSDNAALASGGSLVPNYKDGQKNGLKIIGISPDSVYQRIGLQSGDVVGKINGQAVKSQPHALELLQSFKTNSELSIEVERRGRKETLNYKVK